MNIKLKIVLALFPIFFYSLCQAEDNIFKGKTGKAEIYMNLSEPKYFYKSSLMDILLSQEERDGKIFLYMKDYGGKVFEEFALTRQSEDKMEGVWKSEDAKELPVTLDRFDVNKIKNPYGGQPYVKKLKNKEPFDYVRSAFIKFEKEKTTVFNGKNFNWFKENKSGVSLFRLDETSFPGKGTKIINSRLEGIQMEDVINNLTCSTNNTYNTGDGISSEVKIEFLNENLIGFRIFYEGYCGGAHPFAAAAAYIFDLNTGRQYDINDIISFDKTAQPEPDRDGPEYDKKFRSYTQYQEKFFAPNIDKLLNYPYKNYSDEGCRQDDSEIWEFSTAYLTPEGIGVTPSFPHVVQACEEDFVIPFAKLKAYKNPAFPYEFPSEGNI